MFSYDLHFPVYMIFNTLSFDLFPYMSMSFFDAIPAHK